MEYQYIKPEHINAEHFERLSGDLAAVAIASCEGGVHTENDQQLAAMKLRIQQLESENADLEEENVRLKYALRHDHYLEKMLNKKATHETVMERVESGSPFGLFYIDLNQFKTVNDTVSHEAGDYFLEVFSKKIYEAFHDKLRRRGDLLRRVNLEEGRVGGDEFIIIVDLSKDDPKQDHPARRRTDGSISDQETMHMIEEDVLRRIEFEVVSEFVKEHKPVPGLGLAIGSSYFDPSNPRDAKILIAQAEEAMREDKGENHR